MRGCLLCWLHSLMFKVRYRASMERQKGGGDESLVFVFIVCVLWEIVE